MKKRLVSVLLVVVMMFSLATTSVFAGEKKKAPADPKLVIAEQLVDDCNGLIKSLVKKAQKTKCFDVPELLIEVEIVAAGTKLAVRLLGYDVECIYEEYKVDGIRVLIDPLRVVTPIDTNPGH